MPVYVDLKRKSNISTGFVRKTEFTTVCRFLDHSGISFNRDPYAAKVEAYSYAMLSYRTHKREIEREIKKNSLALKLSKKLVEENRKIKLQNEKNRHRRPVKPKRLDVSEIDMRML